MEEKEARSRPVAAATAMEPAPAATVDLEKAFRNHHALVFRAAYRVTGDPADAEDVLQTVFVRLLRRAPDAAGVDNLESYLYRSAINCGLDLVRSRRKAGSVSLEDAGPLAADPTLAPDRAYGSGELRKWLRQAIARLSPRAAEMFVLRFFEGKSNPEVARLVGTTEGTVAVTLSRTRDRIHTEFQSFWGGKS